MKESELNIYCNLTGKFKKNCHISYPHWYVHRMLSNAASKG